VIISDHISLKEYECSCCHQLPPALRGGDIPTCYEWFFEDFEDIRREYGKPIPIGSGYRCPAHNQASGGAVDSGTVDTTYGAAERDVIKSLRTIVNNLRNALIANGVCS
jgi:hypothetical protein